MTLPSLIKRKIEHGEKKLTGFSRKNSAIEELQVTQQIPTAKACISAWWENVLNEIGETLRTLSGTKIFSFD